MILLKLSYDLQKLIISKYFNENDKKIFSLLSHTTYGLFMQVIDSVTLNRLNRKTPPQLDDFSAWKNIKSITLRYLENQDIKQLSSFLKQFDKIDLWAVLPSII